MRSQMSTIVSCLGAIIAMYGCADAGGDNLGGSTDAVENGKIDRTHTWAVGVCSSAPNQDPSKGAIGACVESGTRCTGSLIAPNLVLTAAHCVSAGEFPGPGFCDGKWTGAPASPAGARVTLASSVLQANPAWIGVKEMRVAQGDLCSGDVALLILDRNISAAEATPIGVKLISMTEATPKKLAIVGRGVVKERYDTVTKELKKIEDGGLLRRYAERIPFICLGNGTAACATTDLTAPSGSFQVPSGMFLLGTGPLSGDSGSALVTQSSFDRGRPLAVGVESSGTVSPTTGKTNGNQAVRLDVHATMIRQAARDAAVLGNYAVPAWVTSTVASD